PRELRGIRRSIAAGRGQKVMQVLRKSSRRYIDALTSADDTVKLLTGQTLHGSFASEVIDRTFNMAMIGVLDDDEAAIEAARHVLRALPATSIAANDGILVHAGLTHPLLAFDLLHDRLSESERRAFAAW